MRISDWSSGRVLFRSFASPWLSRQGHRRQAACLRYPRRDAPSRHAPLRDAAPPMQRQGPAQAGSHAGIARKSVVSGKSVSVRVDLGGRRILKKKKTQIMNDTTYYEQT